MNGGGRGGLEAGVGSAAYGTAATESLKPTAKKVVSADPAGDGPSEFQEVEGQSHREEAARSARALAIEFIRAEEEALSEEPIPISRRNQVLRYFSELRNRIEKGR